MHQIIKIACRVAEYSINVKMPASASFFEIFDRPAFGNHPEENLGRTMIDYGVDTISFDGFDEGDSKT